MAYGACVQAAVLAKKEDAPPIYVRNVTPLTICILSSREELPCFPIVKRNSSYPLVKKVYGKTRRDNQNNAKIVIMEGEQMEIGGNQVLGSITLNGITKSPRGQEIIQISLQIDEKGAISAIVTDEKTKQRVQLNIERPKGFTEKETAEMASHLAKLKEIDDCEDESNIQEKTNKNPRRR